MGIKAHYLLNKAKEKFYPYAHADATFDREGVKVGVRLDELDSAIEEHVEDETVHITNIERTNWNDASDNKHTHSNKSVLDEITSALIESWNNAVTHISDAVKHITSDERISWNDAKNHAGSAHAPSDAEANVQSDWNETDETNDAFIKNKPTIPTAVAVKGSAESSYRTGNVNLTPANLGITVVNNTADANKNVATAVKATQDANGNVITETYATKSELNNAGGGGLTAKVSGTRLILS